jgi:hypothetical protein
MTSEKTHQLTKARPKEIKLKKNKNRTKVYKVNPEDFLTDKEKRKQKNVLLK